MTKNLKEIYEVTVAHESVVGRRVMFREIICLVKAAGFPENVKVA